MPILSFLAFYSCRLTCRRVSRETSATSTIAAFYQSLSLGMGRGRPKQAYFPLAACNLRASAIRALQSTP